MKIITDQTILTKQCEDIKREEYYIFDILEEYLDEHPEGIGLAAPQLGILKKAFIVRYDNYFNKERYLRFANAKFLTGSREFFSIEGCLSIPDKTFGVKRFEDIALWDDIGHGRMFLPPASIVIQHEYDHIYGKTLLQTGLEIRNEDVIQ